MPHTVLKQHLHMVDMITFHTPICLGVGNSAQARTLHVLPDKVHLTCHSVACHDFHKKEGQRFLPLRGARMPGRTVAHQ